jgi:5-methyltetrahydrofolate--homocysteine methyltransferase
MKDSGANKGGLLNIVGGCCGSTPDHIAAIAAVAERYKPRRQPAAQAHDTMLAGLETYDSGAAAEAAKTVTADLDSLSAFIAAGDYEGAVELLRDAIEHGAEIVPVRFDENIAPKAAGEFIRFALFYPEIAKRPFLIESSRRDLVEEALKCLQGKALVKFTGALCTGELERLRRYGAIRSIV